MKPVFRRLFESIKSAFEEPVCIFGCVGTASRRAENVLFVGRESSLTEDLFDIPTMKRAAMMDSERYQEA